jgi:hypothetical protein
MKIYFAFLALVFALPVVADDHAAIVKEAVSNISNDYHKEWAFTQSATEDGVRTVLQYDPRLPAGERWKLITVDGREPTADQIAEYLADKGDEFHEDEKDSDGDLVNLEILSLVEKTKDYWVFRFTPQVDIDEDEDEDEDEEKAARKFMQQVVGTIKIIRNGNYVHYIDLRNEGPIRPVFGVKIKRFLTHLTFGPAGGDGPIVPLSIDVELKGRAMMFIKLDESESVRYTDYEYVGT